MPQAALRKNSKAKSWTSKKIAQLRREGMPQNQAVAAAISMARHHKLVKNPEEEQELQDSFESAEEVARGFHGRENRESFEVEETEVYRENLAFLGEMAELEVFIEARADEGLVQLEFDRKNKKDLVFLACSSDRNQLYLVGNTCLPNEWIEECCKDQANKDKVIIGWVYSVSYFADKHHLTGPKQQKYGTEYIHCFGEQTFEHKGNSNKVWKLFEKIEAGVLPVLIYNKLSGGMELVGGKYEVRDEGIWD